MEQESNSLKHSVKVICEEWVDIKGYEELYQVSNMGRIRSKDRVFHQLHYSGHYAEHLLKGKIMKIGKDKKGYCRIGLTDKNGNQKTYSIHRLVGLHFLKRPEGKNYINHLDCNPSNNKANNLEWCTQSENIQYAYDNGTKVAPHTRKISQYDTQGNLIKIWNSQAEIERTLGIKQAKISKVCLGKRNHAGGYKWEYIE